MQINIKDTTHDAHIDTKFAIWLKAVRQYAGEDFEIGASDAAPLYDRGLTVAVAALNLRLAWTIASAKKIISDNHYTTPAVVVQRSWGPYKRTRIAFNFGEIKPIGTEYPGDLGSTERILAIVYPEADNL